jgi:diphosphomevalonate decarboxylase
MVDKRNSLEYLVGAEWSAPSNIALIKYWGKRENQIPANPSLSMSLSNSCTITSVKAYKQVKKSGLSWAFYFDNKRTVAFEKKIEIFFSRIQGELELDKDLFLEIRSHNTFPHSAGIASSASSMASLALCLLSIEEHLRRITYTHEEFFKKASRLARLGSGSACRSVYGEYSLWGKVDTVKFSSDKYAIALSEPAEIFRNLQDTILIVDSSKKEISSSTGHDLMNFHPFAASRFKQAEENLLSLLQSLKKGNWSEFSVIVENEALSLHAMMLSSSPWFILMKPQTLEIIERIKEFRAQTSIPVTFTLDAGPNVHLIYPYDYSTQLKNFVKTKLTGLCEQNKIIYDKMGFGPVKINSL